MLSPNVRQQVLRKADGIPLFVEEITQAVLESGLGWTDEDRLAAGGNICARSSPSHPS